MEASCRTVEVARLGNMTKLALERGPLFALLAALLFGVSTPAAKYLGQDD